MLPSGLVPASPPGLRLLTRIQAPAALIRVRGLGTEPAVTERGQQRPGGVEEGLDVLQSQLPTRFQQQGRPVAQPHPLQGRGPWGPGLLTRGMGGAGGDGGTGFQLGVGWGGWARWGR